MRAADDRGATARGADVADVDDFAARSGVRADFSGGRSARRARRARTQVELLRILQEALTNVRKHADATVVRVGAEVSDGTPSLDDL